MTRFPTFVALCAALAGAQALPATAQSPDKPVRGGTLVFPVHTGEPNTLDCHGAQSPSVMWRIAPHYSSLLQIDAEKYPAVKGDLAKSWTASKDGLTYEFKLHPNIKFHNGTPLTSHDVKVSYDRMRAPPADVVSLRTGMLDDIQTIETPDPLTVVFRLKKQNASMLQLIGMPFACVYSAKLLAEDPSYPVKRVMGSGPFKFVRYAAGAEWVGERFEDYFKPGHPYLDGFRALSVSAPAATNAVIAGQVAFNMRGLTGNEIDRVKSNRGDEVKFIGEGVATGVHHLVAVNTQHPPLNDPRVRRALALALDHYSGAKAMAQVSAVNLVGGLSRPTSPFARSEKELEKLPGFGRDIESARKEARRLLAEAGHPKLKLNFVNNSVYSFYGVYLADQLRHVGVTLEHRATDAQQHNARKRSGDYDLIFDYLPEYLDDPTVQWSWFLPFDKNRLNLARTNDPKLQTLYEAQMRELDPAKRRLRAQEMEAYLLEQAYVLPLFWQEWRRAVSKDIGGIDAMASNFLKIDLGDIWLKSGGRK